MPILKPYFALTFHYIKIIIYMKTEGARNAVFKILFTRYAKVILFRKRFCLFPTFNVKKKKKII